MEHKLGEIFEYKGDWYQYVKDDMIEYCHGCPSFKDLTCTTGYGSHDCWLEAKCRKLQPVGDPCPLHGHIVQRYVGVTDPVILPKEPFAYYNAINYTVDIEVKQDKQNKEDMNTKTIPVPDCWEFDRIDDNGNIVLKQKEPQLPKTWLECLHVVDKTEFWSGSSEIVTESVCEEEADGYMFSHIEFNHIPCGLGKPMLALCQLLVCRNAWWEQLGWKPDWKNTKEYKWCIHTYLGRTVTSSDHSEYGRVLAFPDAGTAEEFHHTFKDLIEEAKELL